MTKPLSLLVVDVSEDWEEVLKAQERGYFIEWDYMYPGKYEHRDLYKESLLTIKYPHGSVRAGFNAIIDTVRIAHERNVPTYAVEFTDNNSDGEEQTCFSLQPYIQKANRYRKRSVSAFDSKYCKLADKIKAEDCQHLMVIGYDRDDCVMETIKDAVERGITVVTSEHCMLTQDRDNRRESSLTYFRKNTIFLETLLDVWNYILSATDKKERQP